MAQHHKLSLFAAVLININIMIGAGVFINTTELAQWAGALGVLSYVIIGIIMLPLILSISRLLILHPTGGFYVFGSKEINQFVGFLAAWSYFIGKLGSATIMIHVSVLFLQKILPFLAQLHPFVLDFSFLSTFILCNMLNVKTGSQLQAIFTILKLTPIFFLAIFGLFLFKGNNFSSSYRIWEGIPFTIPLVLFSILGFEAACSLSSRIENPEKNASRAVLISYGIVIFIYCIYQFVAFGALAPNILHYLDYRSIFPGLIGKLFPHASYTQTLVNMFHIAIASSALSGSYSIIFSNTWNIYTLAEHKHLFFSSWFTTLNRHHIPWLCVLTEGLVCTIHLLVTQGAQVPLQLTGSLGCTIAYTLSILALLAAKKNYPQLRINMFIPALGLCSCLLLLSSCIYTMYYAGLTALISLISLIIIGIIMFFTSNQHAPVNVASK